MNRITYVLAVAASFAYAGTSEAKQDRNEREAWKNTAVGVHTPAGPVYERRNVTTSHSIQTQGVEPYIARQIELNARSNR